MLDVGFSELALIVVVGFIVIGPKDLPKVIRAVSGFMRQCKAMVDECRSQIDDMTRESGAKDIMSDMKSEQKYITDQFGELREVYDVSDIIKERQAKEIVTKPTETLPS